MNKLLKREVKVRTWRNDVECSWCGKGVLIFNGKARQPKIIGLRNEKPKPLFVHICSYCKAEKPLERQYPYFENESKVIEPEKCIQV